MLFPDMRTSRGFCLSAGSAKITYQEISIKGVVWELSKDLTTLGGALVLGLCHFVILDKLLF